LLCKLSKEYKLEIVTKRKKVFGFVGTDHLRRKTIVSDGKLGKLANLII